MLRCPMPEHSPATIGIAFLHPVLDALRALGCTDEDLSKRLGLHHDRLRDPNEVLLANQVYAFLQWATQRSGDRHFCARLGQYMANGGWEPILPILAGGGSVADFLVRFSQMAERQGPAAQYRLESDGEFALWRLTRPATASAASRFADAIAAGFFVEILKNSTFKSWSPVEIVLVVSDPALVAEMVLPPSAVLSGARGFSLRFPSEWLPAPLAKPTIRRGPAFSEPNAQPEPDLVRKICQLIEVRIEEPDLGPREVAESIGMTRWKLQEALRASGTHFSALREDIRRRVAIEKLTTSEGSIAEIARSLGYSDPSNFTRAFRSWTGKPPRDYRLNYRQTRTAGNRSGT